MTGVKMLLDSNFSPADGLAAEGADFAAGHLDDTVAGGVDGVVAAQEGAVAGTLGKADLADDNLTGFDSLAAVNLNA